MSTNWSSVTNLANSIIGVGILALPLCIKSLGYFLGTFTLLFCGYVTIETANLLVHSAYKVKARSYEQLSMKTFGARGKMLCELGICGMLYGVLVAFHGVIGDSSGMLAQILGMENTPNWRLTVQLLALLTIELPFSLLRNLSSLNLLSVVSLSVYASFTVFVFSTGVGEWLLATESNGVPMVNISGLLKSFPIIALAFNCMTTLLPIYNELPNPSIKRMSKVITYAILFVGGLYLTIGICGSLAFGPRVDGNVLNNFPVSSIIVLFKCGFLFCIALSFPLVVYPTRISINSLYLGDNGDPNHMTNNMFRGITVTLLFSTLVLSIIFPKVDTILSLSGATAGCLIGFIFPGLIYLKVSDPGESGRGFAKFVLVIGLLTTIMGVSNILYGAQTPGKLAVSGEQSVNPKHFNSDQDLGQRIRLDVPKLADIEPGKAEQLGHGDIVAMLAQLQIELDETKRELRAEKALRIENQIMELKKQLKDQNVAVEPEQKVDQPAAVAAAVGQAKEEDTGATVEPVEQKQEEQPATQAVKEPEIPQVQPLAAQAEVKAEPAAQDPAENKLSEPEKEGPVQPAALAENKPEVQAQPEVQVQAQPDAAEQLDAVAPAPAENKAAADAAKPAAENNEEVQEKLEQLKKLEKEKDELLAEAKNNDVVEAKNEPKVDAKEDESAKQVVKKLEEM